MNYFKDCQTLEEVKMKTSKVKLEMFGNDSLLKTYTRIGSYYISLCRSGHDGENYFCIHNATTGERLSRSFTHVTEAYLFTIAYDKGLPHHLAESFAEMSAAGINSLSKTYNP